MQLFQVFHVKSLRDIDSIGGNYPDPNFRNYEWVATVNATDLDHVFALTNTVNSPWFEGPQVKSRVNRGIRSTSVGDLITPVSTDDNRLWRVTPFGFDMIGYSDDIWPPLFPPTEEDYDQQYIKTGNCPMCGADKKNFHWGAFFAFDDAYARHVWCGFCEAEWDEIHLLGGISNIKQSDGEPAPLREV